MADEPDESPGTRGLRLAREAAGGVGKLAALAGVSHPTVSQWSAVPVHHVLTIERATGVSRHDLRPDIYPRDVTADAAE